MGNKVPKWGRKEEGHWHHPTGYASPISFTTTATSATTQPITLSMVTASNSVYSTIPKKDCPICHPKPKEWTMLEWAQKQAEALFWRNPIDSSIRPWVNTNTGETTNYQKWKVFY